jgi:hypothetical protein
MIHDVPDQTDEFVAGSSTCTSCSAGTFSRVDGVQFVDPRTLTPWKIDSKGVKRALFSALFPYFLISSGVDRDRD